MLGLEPGDEAFAVLRLQPPEAQKGMHLVDVAAHAFAHPPEAMHERIAGDLQEIALAMQNAPDERIEKRVALRVAMRHDLGDPFVRGARQG